MKSIGTSELHLLCKNSKFTFWSLFNFKCKSFELVYKTPIANGNKIYALFKIYIWKKIQIYGEKNYITIQNCFLYHLYNLRVTSVKEAFPLKREAEPIKVTSQRVMTSRYLMTSHLLFSWLSPGVSWSQADLDLGLSSSGLAAPSIVNPSTGPEGSIPPPTQPLRAPAKSTNLPPNLTAQLNIWRLL